METASQKQTYFRGDFTRPLDEKNRLTIPVDWREKEPQLFIIVPEPNGNFLLIMSPLEFERVCLDADANTSITPAQRRIFLRQFHADSVESLADKQGRLVLPDVACQQLDLKGDVALVGGRGRFEIWNLEKWKLSRIDGTPTYQDVATALGL
ncbi:MAG: hypothetical protein ABI946_09400 [Chthoniobacterales bacterium]